MWVWNWDRILVLTLLTQRPTTKSRLIWINLIGVSNARRRETCLHHWVEATFTVIWCPDSCCLELWNAGPRVFCPDGGEGIFCEWMWHVTTGQCRGGAGRTRWPSRQPRVETGLPGPGWAQSWVTFVFSSRPWKVLAEFAGSGWVQGYITHCRVSWGNENKRDDELSLFFYYSFYFWSSSSS